MSLLPLRRFKRDCFRSAGSPARIAALLGVAVCLLLLRIALQAQEPEKQAQHTVTAALFSDPHLDPFRDPAKAKRLALASVTQWGPILAEAPSADADAQFNALQKGCGEKLSDADTPLELSAFDDARAARPAVVLVGGDLLVHGFRCRYRTLLDPSGTDSTGLADFAVKTIEFQLQQLQQRFPNTPIHVALGNNDTDCDDYALDEESRLLSGLTESVAAGWNGISAHERTTAKQDFKRFGSYALPLAPAVANTRILVLDDLYLASDYKGTCGSKPNHASAEALLTWVAAQLAEAKREHQAVWLLSHIPPEVNIYKTYLHPHDICHGAAPESFFPSDSFNNLLVQYSDTVRVFIAGHTHVDEIHLLEGSTDHEGTIPLKVIPSLSPISGNAPAYLLASIDPSTATLADYKKRIASTSADTPAKWSTAYDFDDRYQEPAFTAATVSDLFHRWQTSPEASESQIDAYQRSIASGLRLFAMRATWPQQLCAMQHSSARGFADCACSATSGILPPGQSAK